MNKTRILRISKIAVPALVGFLLVVYLAISYLVASGVTSAERNDQTDHPSDYGLEH